MDRRDNLLASLHALFRGSDLPRVQADVPQPERRVELGGRAGQQPVVRGNLHPGCTDLVPGDVDRVCPERHGRPAQKQEDSPPAAAAADIDALLCRVCQ